MEPGANFSAWMNWNRCRPAILVLPAGVAAFLPRLHEAQPAAARINSRALAGMSDSELNVSRKRLAAFDVFLGNHVENVVKFALRFLRRAANRVAAVNRRNVGNVASVVVTAANNVIIEQRFHDGNLARKPRWRKGGKCPRQPAH
jgi:hypothetical protein